MKLPTLFISHGSPTFALEPGRLGPQLGALGARLPRPRAVLVMSPHWMTRALEVQALPAPATIHDFGGFPPALYALAYPAPGAPQVAEEARALLARHGVSAGVSTTGGLDHGAWVPLMHLYPDADVPVLQVSQPATRDPRAIFALGEALAPLREAGVLLVGSGTLTHNLHEFRGGTNEGGYVAEFAEWMWQRIEAGDVEALLDYRSQAPHAVRAHPTDEHLMPLFFALGAAGTARAERLEGGISCGILAMDSYVFDAIEEAPAR